MSEFIFLDTETTGTEFEDRLFQVCYKHNDELKVEYFKPPLPISIKAQSITHVTNKMVEDKEPFAQSQMKKDLQALLQENILVAHNVQFDIAMLVKEDMLIPRYICTFKVARALDVENLIPEYNLQYLRYYLELNVEGAAHEAKDDVLVLEALFERLYKKMMAIHNNHEIVVKEMLRITQDPILFNIIPFGKYRGKRIEELAATDKPYLQWLLEQKLQNSTQDETDWIYSLRYHMGIKT